MGNRFFGLTGNHIAITHLNDDSFATVGATASILISLPGNSQHTASDSVPH